VRSKLIWWSMASGSFITLMALELRVHGAGRLAFYLTYPGTYFMQAFLLRFLEWLPWDIGDNLISETLAFLAANIAGCGFIVFLVLRIFIPDRSEELPPITGSE